MSTEDSHAFDGLIACHDCDLLVRAPQSTADQKRYRCPRCHQSLYLGEHRSDQYVAALSLTSLIVFLVANSFDFLIFSAQGQQTSISLTESAFVLWDRDFVVLAGLVLAFILILPAIYLLGLLLLLVPYQWSKNSRAAIFLGRFMSMLLPWAMADVFLIGVLVALIKVVSIASIVFGLAFWAYVVFTVVFLHLTSTVDRLRLWGLVDQRRGIDETGFNWSEHADCT